MKKLLIILTFLLGYTINSAIAEASNLCKTPKGMPVINITTSYGKLIYNTSFTTSQITELSGTSGHSEQGVFASGLATIKIGKEYALGSGVEALDNDSFCVYPAKIDIFIGYSNPVIYISKELPRGSCQYNLVVRHEQTHQRINKTALEYFLPKFKKAAQKIAEDIKPQRAYDHQKVASITQDMIQEVATKLDKVIAIFEKELQIEQGKLDNKLNYSMEDNICKRFNQESGIRRSKYNQ